LWANLYITLGPTLNEGFHPIGLLLTDTIAVQFVQVCGEVPIPVIPEFVPGGIVVDSLQDYVCGWVVDPEGNSIPGANVEMWADYPQTGIFAQTMSTGIGSFAFSGQHPTPFDLYAYKEGYYPGVLENLNFGAKGVKIVLTPLKPFIVSDNWVDYYSGNTCTSTLFGAPLPVGSVVEAFNPRGTLCGRQIVTEPGIFKFMPVYRDSAGSIEDEGASTGDIIKFTVNGIPAMVDGNVYYPAEHEVIEVCLHAGEVITKECQLHEGWNLVSWNLDTPTDSIEAVLGSISECIDVVLGFEGGGLTFDPELKMFSTLWYADHLSGYWIKIKQGCNPTLTISGMTVPANTPIPVYRGWNLVSYLPEYTLAPTDALASVESKLSIAYGFDAGIKIYQPGQSQFNTLTEMNSCFGYWMKLNSDGILVYPTNIEAPTPAVAQETGHSLMARSASAGYDVTSTTNWINLYSRNLTLNGNKVSAGSMIDAYSSSGVKVGSFILKNDGLFGFMPVYADNAQESVSGLVSGGSFYLTVNGEKTEESFTWTNNGDRLEVMALTTGTHTTVPGNYSLSQNYPNPFNPTTMLTFSLPASMTAKIEVYDVLGKLVATPYDGMASSGENRVVWDGKDLRGQSVASGVYFYRLTADKYTETKKMMLLK
jgi:hypothetical protein